MVGAHGCSPHRLSRVLARNCPQFAIFAVVQHPFVPQLAPCGCVFCAWGTWWLNRGLRGRAQFSNHPTWVQMVYHSSWRVHPRNCKCVTTHLYPIQLGMFQPYKTDNEHVGFLSTTMAASAIFGYLPPCWFWVGKIMENMDNPWRSEHWETPSGLASRCPAQRFWAASQTMTNDRWPAKNGPRSCARRGPGGTLGFWGVSYTYK